MIEILINNENLDLFGTTTIQVIDQSPLFTEDGFIPGSYSIPFTIPITDKNNQILDYPTLIENESRWITYENVVLKHGGMPYKSGKLKIRSAPNPTQIEASFTFGISEISEQLKARDLKSFTNQIIDYGNNGTYKKEVRLRVQNVLGTTKRRFTVIINDAEVYYEHDGSLLPPPSGVFLSDRLVAAINDAGLGNVKARDVAASDNFIIFVDTDISEDHFKEPLKVVVPDKAANQDDELKSNPIDYVSDYTSDISTLQNAFMNQYLVANPPDNKFRFPLIIDNAKRVGGLTRAELINGVINGSHESNSYADTTFNKTVILPCLLVDYFMKNFETYLNIKFTGEFLEPYFLALLIVPENSPAIAEEYIDITFLNNVPYFNLQDYTPEFTIAEYLKSIQRQFNYLLEYNPNTRELQATRKNDYLTSSEFVDITEKCSQFTELEKSEVKGLQLVMDTKLADVSTEPDTLNPYVSQKLGDGEITTTLDFTSTINEQNLTIPNNNFIPLFTRMDLQDSADNNFRYGFYYGLNQDDSGNDYPLMRQDFPGVNLTLRNPFGLYETFWKEWANFLINRSFSKRKSALNILDLKNLDLKVKHRIDRNYYLIKSATTVFTMKDIKPTTLELYSIDLSPNDNTIINN